jgi:hypothetical protein
MKQVKMGGLASHTEEPLRKIAERIQASCPPGIGFTLFLFDQDDETPGAPPREGFLSYISTAQRKDMIETLRSWLKSVEF